MHQDIIENITNFWFGPVSNRPHAANVSTEKSSLWWGKEPTTDAQIKHRFEHYRELAIDGSCERWAETAQGRLALILLIDQFSRNIHRDHYKAFAFDHLARFLCEDGIELGHDQQLTPIERAFFYLPFEHSEFIEDQEKSLMLFQNLLEKVDDGEKPLFEGYLKFAQKHCDIIRKFNRFPHRNRLLSRPSTAQELEFLKQPGSSF